METFQNGFWERRLEAMQQEEKRIIRSRNIMKKKSSI